MIIYNSELYHYGIPRRSGRYKWGSGKDPYHHGADAASTKAAYKRARHDLRMNRLKYVGNRAIHPIGSIHSDWGFRGVTVGGAASRAHMERAKRELSDRRKTKENLKIEYKKAKIMEKHGDEPMSKLQKRLNKTEIHDSKLSKKVTDIQEHRDKKLASKGSAKIKKASAKGNEAKAKAEFKASKKMLRRKRNRAIASNMVHPYVSVKDHWGISGYTKRGKREGNKLNANKLAIQDARKEKAAAKARYRRVKRGRNRHVDYM